MIELPEEFPQLNIYMTNEEIRFWPIYSWSNNPWILDKDGNMVTVSKFNKLQDCTIQELQITRTAKTAYLFRQ